MNWNSLNVISENASTVGSFDLGIYKTDDGKMKDIKRFRKPQNLKLFIY